MNRPLTAFAVLVAAAGLPAQAPTTSTLRALLAQAGQQLAEGAPAGAMAAAQRALERDPNHLGALDILAAAASAAGDDDLAVHTMHRWLDIVRASKAVPPLATHKAVTQLEQRLSELDPDVRTLRSLQEGYLRDLTRLAEDYKRRKDWLAALSVWGQVLAVEPDDARAVAAVRELRRIGGAEVAVEDVYAGGDPLQGWSQERIEAADREHADWESAWTKKTDNYSYRTDAGLLVLETSAIAMEQMNRFYRRFFRFKEDGGQTPSIEIRVFRNRDEYLRLGSGPAEWSGGQFTGSAVETYVGGVTGKETIRDMYRTLFHEAAHQFVSLTGPFVPGWLNEAYASFFEGCTILSNGTVDWNQPANHRLFPLATRLERGFMSGPDDGVTDSAGEWADPPTAPTLRIVVAGGYRWGPPWYAPTWGVVYFLYNYRDSQGLLVYRDALHEYYTSFKRGRPEDPVAHFEEVVLAAPRSPVSRIDDLTPLWRDWILALRDRVIGKDDAGDELLHFAEQALQRGEKAEALEMLEEVRESRRSDVDLLRRICDLLAELKLDSRAAAACRQLARELELRGEPADGDELQRLRARIARLDPLSGRHRRIHVDLAARGLELAHRYEERGMPRMAMEVARRMSGSFSVPEAVAYYEQLALRLGTTLAQWRLAYDERSLDGWSGSDAYRAYGDSIRALVERDSAAPAGEFLVATLTCDVPFDSDYSLEAEMRTESDGDDGFRTRLLGLTFGVKDSSNYHIVVLHPKGFLDVSTNRGGAWEHHEHRIWPVADQWKRLRIDVVGDTVDVYADGLYVRSVRFPSPDVLRGGFGLVTGEGLALYRNIRILARDPSDPSARIDRRLAMKRVAEDPALRPRGSFTGIEPPELHIGTWLQGDPVSLQQLHGRPVMLAFWSPTQDRVIRCTEYYAHLLQRGREHDLALVVVCDGGTDADDARAYLAEHAMPGAVVGIDGNNATFGAYAVAGMPLVLLIGRDGKVRFQGSPGLSSSATWTADGPATFLDDPFRALLGEG